MLSQLAPLRNITMLSMIFRIILAIICGGAVGMERTFKRRPAGLRTHILICLGAAMTTMTSQFLVTYMQYDTDMARIGAQVVAGMGFIGAGSILVTGRQQVRGLTTAAGLWTAAIVGLCLGAGFYEGGVLTTVLILLVESTFAHLKRKFLRDSPVLRLCISYEDQDCLARILALYKELELDLLDMEVLEPGQKLSFAVRSHFLDTELLLQELHFLPGIRAVEIPGQSKDRTKLTEE